MIGIHAVRPMLGYVSVTNGVLSYSQSTNEPVRIQVFDAVGSRVLNETVYGTGTLDMQSIVKSQGSYFARVSVGSAKSNFRFASNGNYGISFGDAVARGLKKEEAGDSLRVIATDYDTLTVALSNLDTNVTLKLKKTVKQPEYAYGWGLKNDPEPTRGCGKDTKLDYKYRGDKPYIDFKWSKGTRTVRIDIPKNYDKNKPYKLIFGMQCMGGWAGGVQDEGYYGLKPLDTENTAIFVAPEGNGNQAPWDQNDYILFDELLAYLEGNFCIDSSRVFSTGFSYGSMFSNGLSIRTCSALLPCTKLLNATSGSRSASRWALAGWAYSACRTISALRSWAVLLAISSWNSIPKVARPRTSVLRNMVATVRMCAMTTRQSKNDSRFAGVRRTVATSGTTRIRVRTSLGYRRRLGTSSISSNL